MKTKGNLFLTYLGGSSMGFNNFPALHSNLIPPQGDWSTYGGGYSTQDTQAYMAAQQTSYSTFTHHQNPYAYAATMFGAGSPGSAGGVASPGADPLGNTSSNFYSNSGTSIPTPVPDPSMGSHDHGSPSSSYKLDFNNIVDEKILGDPSNETEGTVIKSQ